MNEQLAVDYKETVYNSFSIRKDSGDGDVYVTIVENELGNPIQVMIAIGKAGSEIRAWNEALSRTITSLLQQGNDINHIVSLLSEITSDRSRIINNIPVRSGPDAVMLALMEYRGYKFREMEKRYGMADYRRKRSQWKGSSDY